MDPLFYLLIGIVLGGIVGCLLGARFRREGSGTPLVATNLLEAELRQQLTHRDGELVRAREQINETGAAQATAEASRAAGDEQRAESKRRLEVAEAEVKAAQDQLHVVRVSLASAEANARAAGERLAQQQDGHIEQRKDLLLSHEEALAGLREQLKRGLAGLQAAQEELLTLKNDHGRLEAEVKFLNERLATEREQVERIQEKFHKDFESVSNKLLVDNTSKFNQQSAESLDKLLGPLKESLHEFKSSLETTRKETATHSALLKDQVSRVGSEAANLSKALKGDVKVLGNWGENMLDQILEKSGLQRDIHYRRQQGSRDAEGGLRFLDVIITLPEGGSLVIDSKVSLRSYEDSVNAADETARAEHLDGHVDAIRTHVHGLGGKRYQDLQGIKTPDFVLMYVPIEAAYFAAVARVPGLFAEALDQNIVIITNSTLLATLRTVASIWRLADQQKHALEIADRGGKLYDKFVGFVEDIEDVGKALQAAQGAFNAAESKLHRGSGNLVGQTEKLKTLGAKAAKSLSPALVEKASEAEKSEKSEPSPLAIAADVAGAANGDGPRELA